MNSDDWKNLFKSVAPAIGTALGGPLAGAAAAFLADKLGVEEKTVEAVTNALNSGKLTPDQITQVKLAEIDFQKFLKSNDIDMAKIAVEDTKSARDMQMATRSNMPATLTVFIVVGFFFVLGWMMYDPAVKESAPLMIMLGALGAEFTSACKFWFGTTHGSQKKDQMLANSTPNKD